MRLWSRHLYIGASLGPIRLDYNCNSEDGKGNLCPASAHDPLDLSTAVFPMKLQFPKALDEKVRRIAAFDHRSFADTVTMLTEEAIKMREFPNVFFVEGSTGRRARFVSGPDVWEVLEPYVLNGKDWAVLRASYPDIDEAVLRTAVRYYESYPDEIDVRVALNQGS